MPDRILATTAFKVRLVDGAAYIDFKSGDQPYEIAMPRPLLVLSYRQMGKTLAPK